MVIGRALVGLLAAGAVCVGASASVGQEMDPMAPRPATSGKPREAERSSKPKRGDDDALAGPKVDRPSGEKTIVEKNFDGSLVRLDVRPERAAAALLALSPEEKKAVDELFERREKEVAKVLYEHFDTFLAVQAARQGGMRPGSVDRKEREELGEKMRELYRAGAQSGVTEPTLVDQVAKVLPEEQVPEFRRLVREYLEALEEQAQRDRGAGNQGAFSRPGEANDDGRRRGPSLERRSEMNLFLREVARELGAQVQERKERTEALIKAVEATPEQEAQIQKILRGAAEQNRGKKPGAEERAEVFRKIMDLLTPEQRELARERLRGR